MLIDRLAFYLCRQIKWVVWGIIKKVAAAVHILYTLSRAFWLTTSCEYDVIDERQINRRESDIMTTQMLHTIILFKSCHFSLQLGNWDGI